ncbi:MAG: DUF3352 domain-containing protein [Phormidesmis sp.]
MTAAAPQPDDQRFDDQEPDDRWSRRPFFIGLLAVALSLLLAGLGGSWYLNANSPLTLLSGGDRPIAAATAFVPARSPFTLSLLTQPERLVALQQAISSASQRQQTREEIEQIKQSLFENTGLNYDRDLQPWIGSEMTVAFTDADLDLDPSNGQQPGYLLAAEIAPDRIQQAREFLQFFWQQQSLMGVVPMSDRISGVRVLYAPSGLASGTVSSSVSAPVRARQRAQQPTLTSASALVGNEFVIFANDVRVLRRSIRSAQTATNLAQNRAYRRAVAQLPEQRVGLAYVDNALLGSLGRSTGGKSVAEIEKGPATAVSKFTAISLAVTRSGLVSNIRLPSLARSADFKATSSKIVAESAQRLSEPVEALKFLPIDSVIALASRDLTQLAPALVDLGFSDRLFPNFLKRGQSSLSRWDWAVGDYALAQVKAGASQDWILAIARDAEGITQLDEAAVAEGYSAVPVVLGEDLNATVWTRLSARSLGRQRSGSLETEISGLHLQQGDYEIFASSLAAMEKSLIAPSSSLLSAAQFSQAISTLPTPNQGYLYVRWPAIAPAVGRALPIVRLADAALKPLTAHVGSLAATREGEAISLFIQLTGDGRSIR